MTRLPPTLLTLPFEIRSEIFHLALLDKPEIRALDPPYRCSLDLSLLFTNRQVYYETRAIPPALNYVGNKYDPNVSFFSSLPLRPFQIAALKTLGIEYLYPGDLTHFLALGRDNGYLFGEEELNLDLLIIYTEDWIAGGVRRWRPAASPQDVQYDLPKSSRWLRALCGLQGWKQLEIIFRESELLNLKGFGTRGGFLQTLFDDFRSHLGEFDEDFTIWHESCNASDEKITVLRTKELGRYKQPAWRRADVGKLIEGKECVMGGPMGVDEDEGGRPAFHIQERCGGPRNRANHCTRCQ